MARAISSKKAADQSGCLIAFFALFLIMGCGVFISAFVLPGLNCMRAKSWTPTPCAIASSAVATRGSGKDRYCYPDVLFTYSVNGQRYESTRYSFFRITSKNPSRTQGLLNAYPQGSTATCYVNPADASQAVLDRSFPASAFANLFILLFIAVGAGGIVWQLRARRSDKRNESRGRSSWKPQKSLLVRQQTSPAVEEPEVSGPVVLKPTLPPGGVACGLFFFAAIWNGFLGFFFFVGPVRSLNGGIGSYLLILFLIPFVLVGLGVLVAAVASLGALLVPRPKLTASAASVPLGGTLDLDWQLARGKINPQKLQVFLEAREEATYSRGTDTYTDRNVFLTRLLYEDASGSQNGHARITIPADSMHSFEATRNKVVWAIKVKGDVRLWPNFEDEYRIRVLPAARTTDATQSTTL